MKTIYWVGGGLLLLWLMSRANGGSTIMKILPPPGPFGSTPGDNVPGSVIQKIAPPAPGSGSGSSLPVLPPNIPQTRMYRGAMVRRVGNGGGALFKIGGREGIQHQPQIA